MKCFRLIVLAFFPLFVVMGCSQFDLGTSALSKADPLEEDVSLATKTVQEIYYYYFDEKILLSERRDMIFLQFTDNTARNAFVQEMRNGVSAFRVLCSEDGMGVFPEKVFPGQLVLQSLEEEIQSDFIQDLQECPDVRHISFVQDYQGHLMVETNEFAVKLKSASRISEMNDLANKYACEVYQREWFEPDIYFIRRAKSSEYSTVQLASFFYETGLFLFTSPDYYQFDALLLPDTYYGLQWGLNNTGQYATSGIDIHAESAWTITQGNSDIIVAVLDDGVEVHPDLSANLLTGYNADNSTSGGYPLNSDSSHGTSVAGVIGAVRNNALGISGIAPNCSILPVRVVGSLGLLHSYAAAGINWASSQGADVINCSWHFDTPCPLLTNAIFNATAQGRNGKGCVVVVASGNDGGNVNYPAQLANVLAVGAITYTGVRKTMTTPDWEYWWASNYGSNLDVVAPGVHIPTTDLQGAIGSNPVPQGSYFSSNLSDQDYTVNFNGTSSSAPHASGVAALILSEYPNLTQGQVRRAIEMGCTKLSGYSYSQDNEYPSGTWNNEVGYGLVNAYGALMQAAQINQQNLLDSTAGFDFTITNNSSYPLEDIYIELTGTISGTPTVLITCDPGGVGSGDQIGYPVYRGETITATPGTTISNLTLELFACDPYSPGNLRVGVAIDNASPLSYSSYSFGSGDTYQLVLPNSTVPNASRRRLYINILNPL